MLHQSKYFLDLFDCCYDNQSTVPIYLAVKTRPLGMAFDFPKIPFFGKMLTAKPPTKGTFSRQGLYSSEALGHRLSGFD
jgi:hypothetical protein